MDFPKSKNLENKAVTCKSKADNGLLLFLFNQLSKSRLYLSGIPGPLVI